MSRSMIRADSETSLDAQSGQGARLPSSFDAGRALGHVEHLSYPRRAGTPGERLAARYILREFAALGLRRRRERFAVPYVAREVGVRMAFGACALAVLIGTRIVGTHPLLAAASWVAAAAAINTPWRIARGFGTRWPSRTMSQNLVATSPGAADEAGDANPDAPARVVFMAHYDTKSQVLPTGIRIGLVIAATSLCATLTALALAAAAGWHWGASGPLVPWLSWGLVAVLATLAANVSGNRSPGAVDNATGVGTLLELARQWRPRPDAPVEAVWVATGAEEVGLDGARDFLGRHETWWREKPTLLINLDSVGVGARIYLSGEPGAFRLAAEAADDLGLPWSGLRVLGAGMDHQPFAARGLSAVSLLGDVVGASLTFHSPRDVPDRVDCAAIDRAGRLAAHLAGKWAERQRLLEAGRRQEPGHTPPSHGPRVPPAKVNGGRRSRTPMPR
jgi:hypothetical protein